MFPPTQLQLIVELTNQQLSKEGKETTCEGEILKLFGIFILITQYEFGSQAELWATTQKHKYMPAEALGNTGMSQKRFDSLFKALRFSRQLEKRPKGMSHERHCWQLVDNFVENFNHHRSHNFKL